MAETHASENHRLLVSTRNPHKVDEIRAIMGPAFTLVDLSVCPEMEEVEETGSTFEENATLKAVATSQHFEDWVIADDSGLAVDALQGAPGVFSARYSGGGATDASNNALLLKNLDGVRGRDRLARFHCVIVLARAGRKLAAFAGSVEGMIKHAAEGDGGFGYDPLFVPDGYGETFAQLPPAVKNQLSHRARALEKLRAWRGWW